MPFIRRKRGRLLLVHSRREGGRVVQDELVSFDSADAVDEILKPAMWATWRHTLERRYPDLCWDWDSVRRDLLSGAAALRSGGPSPTVQRLAGLAIDLAIALVGLSPAKAGDAAVIAELRPALGPLLTHLNRVLGTAADDLQRSPIQIDTSSAQSIFDEAMDDATTQFGMGLVLLNLGRTEEADRALLHGMAANRYVVPILFGDQWTLLDGWHGTHLAEPEHAAWIVSSTRDLWNANPVYLDHLADLWRHPAVRAWRERLDNSMVALRDAPGATPNRSARVDRHFRLMRGDEIERVRLAATTGESGPHVRPVPEEERFEVGYTYIIDMRHRDAPPDANLPAAFWKAVAYEGRIVEAGSAWGQSDTLDTAIRCRRRPQNKACPGHIRVRVDAGVILWGCTRCRDNGRISEWQGLRWDFSAHRAGADALRVAVTWSDLASLRKLMAAPMLQLLARAEYGAEGPTLVGSATELRFAAMASAATGAEDVADALLAALGPAAGKFEA